MDVMGRPWICLKGSISSSHSYYIFFSQKYGLKWLLKTNFTYICFVWGNPSFLFLLLAYISQFIRENEPPLLFSIFMRSITLLIFFLHKIYPNKFVVNKHWNLHIRQSPAVIALQCNDQLLSLVILLYMLIFWVRVIQGTV